MAKATSPSAANPLRILLVGAGAVGQVYARHLQMGGAEVAFLVRPKYAEEARRGFDLYPLDRKNARTTPVRLEGVGVFTSADEVARERFDAVLLCVAATALREGTWLQDLARATGDALIVGLHGGRDEDMLVREVAGPARHAAGLIGIVSYMAPLPGESVPRPGVAYWLPPLSASPLSGPRERIARVAACFSRGGIRSFVVADAARGSIVPSAVLGSIVSALEAAGWGWADARKGDHLALACAAARENAGTALATIGERPPFALRLLRPFALRVVMRLAPLVAPLDLETYFQAHFTKVGPQMHDNLRQTIRRGEAQGVPTPATRELLRRIEAELKS